MRIGITDEGIVVTTGIDPDKVEFKPKTPVGKQSSWLGPDFGTKDYPEFAARLGSAGFAGR